MRIAAVLLGLLLALSAQASSCSAQSGERTAALVELYTSGGCIRCPPAERWLSSLGVRGSVPGRVVPLSLHVDYGDYIGWKDRDPSGRQRKLTPLQRLALVPSPQVVLQGRDFRDWRVDAAFEREMARINAAPAKALLRLEIESLEHGALAVQARAELLPGAVHEGAALYLAAYENKSPVGHAYVVLEWLGPFPLGGNGRRAERRQVPLLPEAVPGNSGVVGFVQDRRTFEVLQALILPVCLGGKG